MDEDDYPDLVIKTGHERESLVSSKKELTVDDIIEQHVGPLGFAQLLHVFLVSLAWIFDSQNTLITIFTDAQPAWRCKGSTCDPSAMCTLDPRMWEWVGGDKSSTIAEWGLICDKKFQAGIPASLFFLGSLIGSAVHGRLADAYLGRKKTVLLSCLLTSITAFLTSLAPNIWVYALLRFSNGFARSGIGICCLVLSTEVVGRSWRGQVGQYGFFFFTVGFLSLPLVAYPVRESWRSLYKVMSIFPLIYSLLILPYVSESPRWLAIKGRTDEAMRVLIKFARRNGKVIPSNVSISNPTITEGGLPQKTESLWSTGWASKRIATVMLAGFGVGFVYYGVQLNVENLNFNVYFTVAINALMEIPAVFIGSVFLGFTDRRVLFSTSAFLAGISCLLCTIFSGKGKGKGSWAQLGIEAVGFMAASLSFDVIYIYCVELFPTNVRNFSVSMLRQSLMLGAAIAPVMVVLGRLQPAISFFVFGALSIFSGVVTFWLPETRNSPLYETLEQQETEEKFTLGSPGDMEMAT
ncbi:Organic cation/carnitine transporter 1 [Rhynchospora pubera]|uniref:H(+)/Pi cotransporter n=1 Tax=Rhynchospora pubera TaxID=906938 RepID=A0AAV8G2K0_9POAL|nr:Organic cation/carnitine transporter 1 [Rhynchospora pubera]